MGNQYNIIKCGHDSPAKCSGQNSCLRLKNKNKNKNKQKTAHTQVLVPIYKTEIT